MNRARSPTRIAAIAEKYPTVEAAEYAHPQLRARYMAALQRVGTDAEWNKVPHAYVEQNQGVLARLGSKVGLVKPKPPRDVRDEVIRMEARLDELQPMLIAKDNEERDRLGGLTSAEFADSAIREQRAREIFIQQCVDHEQRARNASLGYGLLTNPEVSQKYFGTYTEDVTGVPAIFLPQQSDMALQNEFRRRYGGRSRRSKRSKRSRKHSRKTRRH
jgi:hypothetical protein